MALGSVNNSLYRFLAEEFGLRVDHCDTTIAATSVRPLVARRLAISPGQPVLELTQTHHAKGEPLIFSHNFHNSALVRFEASRTVLSAE